MKELNNSKYLPRRKFDRAFKEHAVRAWLDSGRSARETAEELGINENQLYLWKQKFNPAAKSPASQAELEDENTRLRRENAALRQRCDILKKTLGILSEAPNNGSNA